MTDAGGPDDDTRSPDFSVEDRIFEQDWHVFHWRRQTPVGSTCWVVCGSNGLHTVEAEGGTLEEAWRHAREQARSRGMLGRTGADE